MAGQLWGGHVPPSGISGRPDDGHVSASSSIVRLTTRNWRICSGTQRTRPGQAGDFLALGQRHPVDPNEVVVVMTIDVEMPVGCRALVGQCVSVRDGVRRSSRTSGRGS